MSVFEYLISVPNHIVHAGLDHKGTFSQDQAFWNVGFIIDCNLNLNVGYFLVHYQGVTTHQFGLVIVDLRAILDTVCDVDGQANTQDKVANSVGLSFGARFELQSRQFRHVAFWLVEIGNKALGVLELGVFVFSTGESFFHCKRRTLNDTRSVPGCNRKGVAILLVNIHEFPLLKVVIMLA